MDENERKIWKKNQCLVFVLAFSSVGLFCSGVLVLFSGLLVKPLATMATMWTGIGLVIVGFFVAFLNVVHHFITDVDFQNTRLTATPESKRLAESGLRGQIHRWRDEAYLTGKTTVRKRITTLTMAEIAAVYPRVKQISVYDVEFDFAADDKYERL